MIVIIEGTFAWYLSSQIIAIIILKSLRNVFIVREQADFYSGATYSNRINTHWIIMEQYAKFRSSLYLRLCQQEFTCNALRKRVNAEKLTVIIREM